MIATLRRILPLVLALGLTSCVHSPAAKLPTSALPEPPAPARPLGRAHATKSASVVRPRVLDGALTLETLRPAASSQPLEDALYASEQPAALRSAGFRQLSAQHLGEGRPGAALVAARAGHDLALSAYGPDHVETITALIALSDALTAAGRQTEGETTLLLAARRAQNLFGAAHPASRAATRRLALIRRLEPIAPLLRSFSRNVNRRG